MYGRLACMDCKVALWPGKAVKRGGKVSFFHVGSAEQPPNAARPELNRVLWKMLADHAEHNLRVALQGHEDDEYIIQEGFVGIGGDTPHDISFEDYLKDWPG